MPFNFSEEQQRVIDHSLPAHGRVFAGPGTGKSATAIALGERLQAVDNPPRIKFLTFTRAATLELAKKASVESKVKPATVHSFSIATLLANPGCAPFPIPLRIADRYEYKQFVRPHLAKLVRVKVRNLDKLVREMAAKWESLNPVGHPDVTPDERARFMGAYTQHRKTFGYTLLDELPELLRTALHDHEDLNGVDFNLMIVDEYQDLNACELDLLKILGDRGASILAIGDDFQSIYSFRKAHPIGIQRFLTDYPGAQDYTLSICQRLPRKIAEWAQFVAAGHTGVVHPPIRCRDDAPAGTLGLLNFGSEVTEARGVADLVCWLNQSQGISFSEILLLSRTDHNGTFTQRAKEELSNRQIPVHDPSIVEKILADDHNRGLLALLRLAVDQEDSLAWRTLIHLERGIGEEFTKHIYEASVSSGKKFGSTFVDLGKAGFPDLPKAMIGRAVKLYSHMTDILQKLQPPVGTADTKWGQWIMESATSLGLPGPTDDLKNLLSTVDDIYTDSEDGLGRYLSQLQPISEDLARNQSDGVRFMTMVSSKGLTVKATIILGVDNDLIPRPEQDLEEERRLLYVAMTRSTDALFLTWVNRRRGPGARAGNPNIGRRTYCEFLRSGPVESENGEEFIRRLSATSNS